MSGVANLRELGCHLYVVNVSDADDDTIWVYEVWHTKEHHDASLRLPEVKAAISLLLSADWVCSPGHRRSSGDT